MIDTIAEDELIEDIEDPVRKFYINIQWHPEFHINTADAKLFTAFVAACRK